MQRISISENHPPPDRNINEDHAAVIPPPHEQHKASQEKSKRALYTEYVCTQAVVGYFALVVALSSTTLNFPVDDIVSIYAPRTAIMIVTKALLDIAETRLLAWQGIYTTQCVLPSPRGHEAIGMLVLALRQPFIMAVLFEVAKSAGIMQGIS